METTLANRRLEALIELLEIPPHYYELAQKRNRSFGEWLHRPESSIAKFTPDVYPQGSFRYGTVVRPLLRSDEYDLDLVSEIRALSKTDLSQHDLKQLVGDEVKAYAESHGLKNPPREKKRCWRLDYADEVHFHMDILPAVPEERGIQQSLSRKMMEKEFARNAEELARYTIAITDMRHPQYRAVSRDWPSSNPKGYARWFEAQMRPVAEKRFLASANDRVHASVDDIPVYQWKTPLQRAIQILKRHRDVMFQSDPEGKPISMIITTLAAHAYGQESQLYEALVNIIDQMPQFVRREEPRVPNPVNPDEDFADKWKTDPRLETNFWQWHARVKADVEYLAGRLGTDELKGFADRRLGLTFGEDRARELSNDSSARTKGAAAAAPTVRIQSPPKPWAENG